MRWLERRILKHCQLLIVSSPGFMEHYFAKVQDYDGDYLLIENKLYLDPEEVPRTSVSAASATVDDEKITVLWSGNLRCQKSLDLLLALARELPNKVTIQIYGLVYYFAMPDFDELVAALPNVEYHGQFSWPDGLVDVYQNADLVWAQDMSESGANSEWLIPNRVYESGYFGVPALAISSTQTGKTVQERGLGYVLKAAQAADLIALIKQIDIKALRAYKSELLGRPATEFIASAEDEDVLGAIFPTTNNLTAG